MAIGNTLGVSPLKPAVQMGVVGALGQKVTPQTVKSTQTGIIKQEQQKSSDMVSKYKQLVSNGVDPQRAKSLLIKTQQPQAEQSTIKNVGEGLTSFAGGLPKVISETGILDKPVSALAQKVVNPLRSAIGKEALTPEQISSQKFSQMASGSQVGGDPESKVAKRVETAMDVAGAVGGLSALAKGVSKSSAKKGLTNIIKEGELVGSKRAALRGGTFKDQATGIRKFLFGTDDVVKPSKRTEQAVKTITSEIKDFSQKPGKLYEQVNGKIADIAGGLGGKLKQIKVGTMTQKNKAIKDAIKGFADETRDLSSATAKKIDLLATNISKAKNADEVWDAAKKLDMMVGDNIKKGVNLSGKDQFIYNAWRSAREAVNSHLDDIASGIDDSSVKEAFKKMSDLYHAKGQIEKNISRLTKKSPGLFKKAGKAAKQAAGLGIIGAVGGAVGGKIMGRKNLSE